MATQPVKPPTPPPAPAPQPPRNPAPPPAPPAPPQPPKAAEAQATTIGMPPTDPNDPQAAKFVNPPPPAPPTWEKNVEAKPWTDWTPDPAIDPLAEKPPEHTYADGMPSPVEQRARSAWLEANGMAKWDQAVDQTNPKPTFDPHALSGGGAFVSAGAQQQVPGVVPPTKRYDR